MAGLIYFESKNYLYRVEFGQNKLPINILKYSKKTKSKILLKEADFLTYQDLSAARIITKKRYEAIVEEN